MSEEANFKILIQEIKDIYEFLTKGEPTPDDEIEARVSLIDLFQKLKNVNSNQVGANKRLFEDIQTRLENWDTLDLWFTESEIPDYIKKVINLPDKATPLDLKVEAEKLSTEIQVEQKSTQIDIKEIVDQVSDKFKDEIDVLKQKIDFLQHEIDDKDEKFKNVPQKKVIKITPNKNVKLPPPKIKIPIIKKLEKPPKILGQIKEEVEKPPEVLEQIKGEVEKPIENIGVKSIEDVQIKIKEELEKLKPIPAPPITPSLTLSKAPLSTPTETSPDTPLSTIPEIPPDTLLDTIPDSTLNTTPFTPPPPPPSSQPVPSTLNDLSSAEDLYEEKSDLSALEELKPIPIKPKPIKKEELPKESTSILDILNEQETDEYKEEEPIIIKEESPPSKKSMISTEVSLIEEEPVEIKKTAPFLLQDPIEKEEPEPVLAPTPKISSVSVEEIENEVIKSTGIELFDVFSSVGNKRAEKLIPKNEYPKLEPSKEKKKKESKKKKKEDIPLPFVEFGSTESQTNTAEEYTSDSLEELPKDKDSLYQELIALEGRRYSLEKTFKEIEKSYNGGSIADLEYKNRSEDLKNEQDEITSRINRIRRVIASM